MESGETHVQTFLYSLPPMSGLMKYTLLHQLHTAIWVWWWIYPAKPIKESMLKACARGWLTRHLLLNMYLNLRFPERKQVVSINHTIYTKCLGTMNHFFLTGSYCQMITLQAGFYKGSSLHLAMLTVFLNILWVSYLDRMHRSEPECIRNSALILKEEAWGGCIPHPAQWRRYDNRWI